MAGGAQGGGAKPVQSGVKYDPQASQQYQQFQQALQNYRQGAMEMPSQMPGANAAAPGGGMPQFGMAKPMPMPAPGGGMAQPAVMPQGPISVDSFQPQGPMQAQPQPQVSQPLLQAQPMPRLMPQAPMQEQQRPMPRSIPRQMPQIEGNPNAMPLQRPPTREQQMYQRYMRGRG